MRVVESRISGLKIIEPRVFGDNRGFFIETWQKERYLEYGMNLDFVQDNLSYSKKGVLRGLHLQDPCPQGKLVYVLQGAVFDVAVDVRPGSPTYGEWESVELSSENRRQFYVPPGMAHGFCVTSDTALFTYKVTDFYHPEHEMTILWNDPDIGIEWPVEEPALSAKDASGLRLIDFKAQQTGLPGVAKPGTTVPGIITRGGEAAGKDIE